uniref:Uncharacterized protein n=1 Tax=Solanum tuberosum TaxID=4113 RepID=M1DQH2_SOLTU
MTRTKKNWRDAEEDLIFGREINFETKDSMTWRRGKGVVAKQFRDAVPYRPKFQNLKDAEGKSRMVMKVTKGRIADWIGDPD